MRNGRPILIEGRLKLDQWEDKTTHQKKSKLGVVLESFSFLDSGRGEGSPADPGAARPAAVAPSPATGSSGPAPADPEAPPAEEDDVPF